MKRIFSTLLLTVALSVGLAACGVFGGINGETPASGPAATAQQQALATKIAAYTTLDQVVLSTNNAIKANLLKGQDASNAQTVIKTAREGLRLLDGITDPTQVQTQSAAILAGLNLLKSTLLKLATTGA